MYLSDSLEYERILPGALLQRLERYLSSMKREDELLSFFSYSPDFDGLLLGVIHALDPRPVALKEHVLWVILRYGSWEWSRWVYDDLIDSECGKRSW